MSDVALGDRGTRGENLGRVLRLDVIGVLRETLQAFNV